MAPMEQHIKEAVETFTMHAQRDLDAHVRLLTSDLLRAAQETHDSSQAEVERAVGEARTAAEQTLKLKLDALHAESAREMELRVAAHQAELERAVSEARTAAEQTHKLKLDELRSELAREMELRVAADQTELERAVSDARTVAEQTFGLKLAALRVELTGEMERRLAADRAELQAAEADRQARLREGRLDRQDRLLGAMRRIDDATTLSGILEALANGASAETSRVAILLVEGDTLRTWGHFGFATNAEPVDLSIGKDGVLAAAVMHRQTSFVRPLLDKSQPALPAFMRVSVGHVGLVTPIVLDGEVVAVLYGDDVDQPPAQEASPVWTEQVQLLVRHASLRLESVTSERAVEVLARQA